MHQNPVSSFVPAGGTIGCDRTRIIAMPEARADDKPVARLHSSEKTAQTHRSIKATLNAQSNHVITHLRRRSI